MPGVPSYRGCDACRRQKKKCDQARPACSRCSRLSIPCVGVGIRRFRFKDESTALAIANDRLQARKPVDQLVSMLSRPCRVPSNEKTTLIGRTIHLLDVTHPGYDVHCYGPVMKELPKRLGHHYALDAAAIAFVGAVTSAPSETVSSECLSNYVTALNRLQHCLQDRAAAYTADTLCAVYLVTICHGWMARKGDRAPNHGRGMLQLMKNLVSRKPDDEFLVKAILSVTGALMYESAFNDDIELDSWLWTVCRIYKPHHLPNRGAGDDKCAGAGYIFQSCEFETLATISKLMRHPTGNTQQIKSIYTMVRDEYAQLKQFGHTVVSPMCTKPFTSIDAIRAQTSYHQAQALMLAICIAFNFFLRNSQFAEPALDDERLAFCADAVMLAEEGKLGRPLAAVHIPLSTVAAWLVSADDAERTKLRDLLQDYQGNFGMLHFVTIVSQWKNAPTRLQQLSWFPTNATGLHVAKGIAGKEDCDSTSGYEGCCIL